MYMNQDKKDSSEWRRSDSLPLWKLHLRNSLLLSKKNLPDIKPHSPSRVNNFWLSKLGRNNKLREKKESKIVNKEEKKAEDNEEKREDKAAETIAETTEEEKEQTKEDKVEVEREEEVEDELKDMYETKIAFKILNNIIIIIKIFCPLKGPFLITT